MSLITIEQAARYARVDPWFINAAVNNGRLKSIALEGKCGRLRTKREWVDECITNESVAV